MQAVSFTSRQHAAFLLLVCAGEIESAQVCARIHFLAANANKLRAVGDGLEYGLLRIDIGVLLVHIANLDCLAYTECTFIGIIRGYDSNTGVAKLEVKNKIIANQEYLVITSEGKVQKVKILSMNYKDIEVEVYTIAGDIIDIKTDIPLHEYDLIRAI